MEIFSKLYAAVVYLHGNIALLIGEETGSAPEPVCMLRISEDSLVLARDQTPFPNSLHSVA
jgi:hypothetical protein